MSGVDQVSAVPLAIEDGDEERTLEMALPANVRRELPNEVWDLVFAYLRIESPELRRAALRAVRAIAQTSA